MVALLAAAIAMVEVPADRMKRLDRGIAINGWWSQVSSMDAAKIAEEMRPQDIEQLARAGFHHVAIRIAPVLLDPDAPGAADRRSLLLSQAKALQDAGLAMVFRVDNDDATGVIRIAGMFAGADPRWVFIETRNIEAARAAAPKLTILADIPAGVDLGGIKDVDRNCVYRFTFSDPRLFTHQGLRTDTGDWTGLKDVPYPSSPMRIVTAAAAISDANLRTALRQYGADRWDAERIADQIRPFAEWGRRNRVYVGCGWFGAARANPPKRDRSRYLEDVRNVLQTEGIGWTVSEYLGDFGLYAGPPDNRKAESGMLSALGLGG